MDTSFLDALAESGMPLISSPVVPPVTLENPSTLQLAIIGIATIAAYWAVRRLLSQGKQQATVASASGAHEAVQSSREAA